MNVRSNRDSFIHRYSSLNEGFKASLWFVICNFVQKGISMLSVPIFTRLLTTEQYGIYTVFQSWYSIITIFATLNLYSGIFNVGMSKYEEDSDGYLISLQSLCTLITGSLFVIYTTNTSFWNSLFGLSSIFMYAMFVELFFAPAFTFWSAKERYNYRYKRLILATVIFSIGSPLLGVIAVLNTTYKSEARIISYVFVQATIGLFFYIYNATRAKKILNMKYWKYALSFNIPLVPHYLSQIILSQSDRLMINSMVGATQAAIYSVTYNVSSLMQLVINAINSSFIPYTYSMLKKKQYKEIAVSANGIIALVAVATMGFMLMGPEIISAFAPKSYYEAIWAMPPVSAAIFFMFQYPLYGNVEFYFGENKFVTLASVGGAILNIILNWLLIPIFGYIVAGYTTLVCYILYAVGHYIIMKIVLKKHNIMSDIYDIKFILICSVAVIGFMILTIVVYHVTIIRYSILITGIVSVIFCRQRIMRILKNIKTNN